MLRTLWATYWSQAIPIFRTIFSSLTQFRATTSASGELSRDLLQTRLFPITEVPQPEAATFHNLKRCKVLLCEDDFVRGQELPVATAVAVASEFGTGTAAHRESSMSFPRCPSYKLTPHSASFCAIHRSVNEPRAFLTISVALQHCVTSVVIGNRASVLRRLRRRRTSTCLCCGERKVRSEQLSIVSELAFGWR